MTKRIITSIILILTIVIGCSSEKRAGVSEFLPKNDGQYTVVIFNQEMLSEDYQKRINPIFNTSKKLNMEYMEFRSLNKQEAEQYKKALSIKRYPVIIVCNKKGIVLQTEKPEDLVRFFLK